MTVGLLSIAKLNILQLDGAAFALIPGAVSFSQTSPSGTLTLSAPSFALAPGAATFSNGSGLKINLVYDTSPVNWNTAPAWYQTDVITARDMLQAAFPNTNCTVNIEVGYTELENIPGTVGPGTSAGDDLISPSVPYSDIRAALAAIPSPTASLVALLANTPAGPTLNGTSSFSVSSACCKALKLFGYSAGPLTATDTAIDGVIGIGTGWSSAKTVGVFLHEITHAMGRIPARAPFVFSRFTSAGVRDFNTGATNTYFSLDGGTTNLAAYDGTSDVSDFTSTTTDPGSGLTDAFDAQQSATPDEVLSPLDIQLLNSMGFQ